jgi:polysaccharide biosynthesis transport protein
VYPLRLSLKNPKLDHTDVIDASVIDASVQAVNFLRLISALRRRVGLFVVVCLSGIATGALYVLTATPLYTASANIIIENREIRAVRDVSPFSDPAMLDPRESVQTQVEVLRSEKIGLAVINDLNLRPDDPAFPMPSWGSRIWASFVAKLRTTLGFPGTSPDPEQDLDRKLEVLLKLNRNLSISRVGHTFVLQVDYTSPSRSRAAEIANAYTTAYVAEQVNLGIAAARNARSWLQKRTEELRQQSLAADGAVQKFKAEHNLLSTKGQLASEQQFTEMTTQLVNAQAATAQAKARYERIQSIVDKHQTEAAVTESLANPVINELRTKYLDVSRRMSQFEPKLGHDHIAIVTLRNEMAELSSLLFEEFGLVAETYRNEYEAAAGREKALNAEVARDQSIAVAANDAQVQLRQLEQKSEAYKSLYRTFLERYQETGQQQSFTQANVRIISEASQPLRPSYPRTTLVLCISLMLGMLTAAGAVTLREHMDYVFRTTEQVRAELGVDLLGLLPIVSCASSAPPAPDRIAPIMRYAIDNPLSVFAEVLRTAKVAADLALGDKSPKIVGIVSLLPKEGKSTVAENFASLLAFQGAATLLIDADTRNPALTRAIGCERRKSSQCESSALPPLAELVRYEPESGLCILPCIYDKDDPRTAEGLTAATFSALLKSSDRSFQYVVIDLPPIGPVISARGMAPAIDAFIFVVEWGVTSRGAVRATLGKEHSMSEKLLGVILNKVDMKKLKTYEHFGSDGYYNRLYEEYYNLDR